MVRIAPNRVSFNTVGAFKAIYDGRANVKKGLLYKNFIASNGGRVDLVNSDHAAHTRKRKIISRAFSEKALRMNELSVVEHQRIWLEEVTTKSDIDGENAWSEPVDMSRWIPYLTLDTVAEIGFSRNFGLTKDESFQYLPRLFSDLVRNNF